MRRFLVLLAFATLASTFLVPSPSHAGGGGFCDGRFSDARGTTVEISGSCFTPTILRVDPGDEVTFTNFDPYNHMVGGVLNVFGDLHTELAREESVAYTFEDEGVFPYVCVLHPGMAGAIVVGDGEEKISRSSVTGGAVAPPADATAVGDTADAAAPVEQPKTQPASADRSGNLWLLGLLVLGMAGAMWWLRKKPQQEV